MSVLRQILMQECELCHKELEVKNEMPKVTIPIYSFDKRLKMESFSICKNCMGRMYSTISKELNIVDLEWSGIDIKWRDE